MKQVSKNDWRKMSLEEKRRMFRVSNVHVVNDDHKTALPVNAFSADEIHPILDIYEARFCHGKNSSYCSSAFSRKTMKI